jgi:hypothetical protein
MSTEMRLGLASLPVIFLIFGFTGCQSPVNEKERAPLVMETPLDKPVTSTPKAIFTHEVDTVKKPWTNLDFHNDPEHFQFVIVSDRTGGHRPGVFPSAMKKLNLLRPEFIITVGDMIEGYHEDEKRLHEEWVEFNGFLEPLEMPFFYLPGNHDNINDAMKKVYTELFGRMYYAFVYRDVLFLCLDTQDGASTGMGEAQTAWAVETVKKHADVRWTFVMMHQPMWVYEEGNMISARKTIGDAQVTGYGAVQQALGDRPYTAFAGHWHQYIKFVRNDRDHIVLGPTGGSSQLRGTEYGEFDHGVWVTMTPDGPVLANLLLEGIQNKNVHTEKHLTLRKGLDFELVGMLDLKQGFKARAGLENLFSHVLDAKVVWNIDEGSPWRIEPSEIHHRIASGQTQSFEFQFSYSGDALYPVFPTCTSFLNAGSEFNAEITAIAPIPLNAYLAGVRPTTHIGRTEVPPVLDGTLNDMVWQQSVTVSAFREMHLAEPSVATEAWLAYDDDNLYVAMRCHETNLAGLVILADTRDGNVFLDDSIEMFLGLDAADPKYYQFAANSTGVVFDAQAFDNSFNSGFAVGTGREAAAWTIEASIPWKDIGATVPDAESRMTLQLVRTRGVGREVLQYPPLNGGNHRRALHGFMSFEEK